MINFEPCNPPLVDPLFLSSLTLGSDTLPKPLFYHHQTLKISLFPENTTKLFPLRPIAIRPDVKVKSPSPPRNQTVGEPPNAHLSSPLSSQSLLSHRSISPSTCSSITCPDRISILNSTSPPISVTTPLRTTDTSPRYSPDLPKKISPGYKKSTRSSPYSSPKTSPHSNPCVSKAERRRNERQGISESQFSILKDWFGRHTYLTIDNRKIVSQETGLPEKTVMYWFQNQRRKVKRNLSQNSTH